MQNTEPARFLQMHWLTGYPAALINRDDAGYAKRITFGGSVRTRISSQCLKRHWRTDDGPWALSRVGLDMAIRSRETLERCIVHPLVDEGLDEALVRAALKVFRDAIFQKSEKARAKGEKETFETEQVTVLGKPEVDYLRSEVAEVVRAAADEKDAAARAAERVKAIRANINALRAGAGLDAAMFGRMVTSDVLARKNAAVHVAHAFTVHAEEAESDYFTAVDDLITGVEESGSGHLGQTELTSGLYYGYLVVDMPTLVANIEGCAVENWLKADQDAARKAVTHLLHLAATVSPGAKLGSTAPHAMAEFVLLEVGARQPRTLANAFRAAVRPEEATDVRDAAIARLRAHVEGIDAMYGRGERRWQADAGVDGEPLPGARRLTFPEAVEAAVAALGTVGES